MSQLMWQSDPSVFAASDDARQPCSKGSSTTCRPTDQSTHRLIVDLVQYWIPEILPLELFLQKAWHIGTQQPVSEEAGWGQELFLASSSQMTCVTANSKQTGLICLLPHPVPSEAA